jgi:hypothetical protein
MPPFTVFTPSVSHMKSAACVTSGNEPTSAEPSKSNMRLRTEATFGPWDDEEEEEEEEDIARQQVRNGARSG